MPRERPMSLRRSLISVSDFSPKFFTSSSSSPLLGGALARARVLRVGVPLGDGREQGVDGQKSRGPVRVLAQVLGGHVAAALGDFDLHLELAAGFEVAEHEVGGDDLYVGVLLD